MILSKTDFLLYRIHFVEYLAWLIFKNKIDPLETLDEEDLRFVIRRENLAAPKRIPWESKDAYRQKLLQVNVPLFPPSLPPWRSFFPSFFLGSFFPSFSFFFGGPFLSGGQPLLVSPRLHYTEYLVEKINAHKLDPVSIFDEADLRVCLRRNGKPVPVRRWESEKLYRDKLIKVSTPA